MCDRRLAGHSDPRVHQQEACGLALQREWSLAITQTSAHSHVTTTTLRPEWSGTRTHLISRDHRAAAHSHQSRRARAPELPDTDTRLVSDLTNLRRRFSCVCSTLPACRPWPGGPRQPRGGRTQPRGPDTQPSGACRNVRGRRVCAPGSRADPGGLVNVSEIPSIARRWRSGARERRVIPRARKVARTG